MIIYPSDRSARLKYAIDWWLPEWLESIELKQSLALTYSEAQVEELLLLCLALSRLSEESLKWSPRTDEKLEDCVANFEAACAAVIESEQACADALTPIQKRYVTTAVEVAREVGGPCPQDTERDEEVELDVLFSNIGYAAVCILMELRRGLPFRSWMK